MKNLVLIMAVLILASAWSWADEAGGADPQAISLSSMSAAELMKQGDTIRTTRDYAEAMRYYQAAAKKDPNNSNLYNKMGMTEWKRDNKAAAAANFDIAVKLNGKNADALNNIGALAYTQKNYGRAVKFYKKALALDETNASYHSNLGTVWFDQKKYERAMAEYARAIELDPEVFLKSNTPGSVARVLNTADRANYEFMLAKAYASRGDSERCFQWLQKAKEDGYSNLKNVYKDAEFAKLRQDPRLAQIVPPPAVAGY
jgi:tetratricopeptide (TPR) repeat protein